MDPVPDQAIGMLQQVEAMPMHALLLEHADHPLDQTVLLRAVPRDEFLTQSVASQGREAAAGEDQPIVRTQQERLGYSAQRGEARDQGLLQR